MSYSLSIFFLIHLELLSFGFCCIPKSRAWDATILSILQESGVKLGGGISFSSPCYSKSIDIDNVQLRRRKQNHNGLCIDLYEEKTDDDSKDVLHVVRLRRLNP